MIKTLSKQSVVLESCIIKMSKNKAIDREERMKKRHSREAWVEGRSRKELRGGREERGMVLKEIQDKVLVVSEGGGIEDKIEVLSEGRGIEEQDVERGKEREGKKGMENSGEEGMRKREVGKS